MTPEKKGEKKAMKCLNDWIDALMPKFNPVEIQTLKTRMSSYFKEYEKELDIKIKELDVMKVKINYCIDWLKKDCKCENLADPEDNSRYANYEKNSGYCRRCKIVEWIGEIK